MAPGVDDSEATEFLDVANANCPVSEGIDDLLPGLPLEEECDGPSAASTRDTEDATSDEEAEAGGIPRVRRGEGWGGYGPPLSSWRKGLARPMVDGGGLPSPGRWPIE